MVDPNIEFALATKDPTGKATQRDHPHEDDSRVVGPDDGVKSARSDGIDPWPRDRYLNIWVCNLGQGPARLRAVPGRTGGDRRRRDPQHRVRHDRHASTAPFNKGRTATHEIGHFLNLRHIWGDRNDCTRQRLRRRHAAGPGANTGKPKFPHITCNNGPNGDMFMNYMDYVDDDAMFMFTVGQVARMNATLAGPRKTLAAAKV